MKLTDFLFYFGGPVVLCHWSYVFYFSKHPGKGNTPNPSMAKKGVDQSGSSALLADNSQKRKAKVLVVEEVNTPEDNLPPEPTQGADIIPRPPIPDPYPANSVEDRAKQIDLNPQKNPEETKLDKASYLPPVELNVEFEDENSTEINQLAGQDLTELLTKIKRNIANPIEKGMLLTLAATPSQDHELIFEKMFSSVTEDSESDFIKDLMNDAF